MRAADGESTQDIVDFYQRAWAAADAAIRELPLEATGTAYTGRTVSLRWVLVHMIEDTVRHAGHADILRELIDGGTGHHVPRRRADRSGAHGDALAPVAHEGDPGALHAELGDQGPAQRLDQPRLAGDPRVAVGEVGGLGGAEDPRGAG